MLGNTDVFEAPFSVTAFTSELIRNQGARSIDDVLQNDPSVRTGTSPTFPIDQTSIRGFTPDSALLFDGMQGFFGYNRAAIQNFERVEIFKGPTAGLIGTTAGVGGTINLVPKRALDTPVRAVDFSWTDRDLIGTHFDIGQRFGVDNAFGARLNFTSQSGHGYDDSRLTVLAPQLALDFRAEAVRVVLDAGHFHQKAERYGDNYTLVGTELPAVPDPRKNFQPSWKRFDSEQSFGLLTGEWDINSSVTAYARYGEFKELIHKRLEPLVSDLDSAGQYTVSGGFNFLFPSHVVTSDVGLRGNLTVGTVSNQWALSVTRIKTTGDGTFNLVDTPVTNQSIYSPNTAPNPEASLPPDAFSPYDTSVQRGVALSDTVSLLNDRLKITGSIRHLSIKVGSYDDAKTSPTVAALYKLDGGWSIYGNYAEALTQGDRAPDDAANPGVQLPPYVAKQKEVGVKWNRGTYGVTGAVFQIEKTFALLDANNFFVVGGRQRNTGVELQTFGEIVKGVRLLGGGAFIDAKQRKTAGGVTDGKRALGAARLTANIGGEYDIGPLPGTTLTGRYIYYGNAYLDAANTQKIGDWSRVDLGVRYTTKAFNYPMTFHANIENVFDQRYWQVGGRNQLAVAPPRTFNLATSISF